MGRLHRQGGRSSTRLTASEVGKGTLSLPDGIFGSRISITHASQGISASFAHPLEVSQRVLFPRHFSWHISKIYLRLALQELRRRPITANDGEEKHDGLNPVMHATSEAMPIGTRFVREL